jgi:hypothetical protein
MRSKNVSTFEVFWNARKDGKRNIPAPDSQNHPPFIKSIIDTGQRHVDEIGRKWEEEDKKLNGQYQNAFDKKRMAEQDYEEAQTRKSEAVERHKEAELNLQNLEHVSPGRKGYWLFFIFLMLAEFPINSFVFELFGEAKWLTYLMSLLICFAIPYSAHIAGMDLKSGVGKSKVITIKFIIMMVVVICLLLSIAYMREKFFEGAKAQEILGIEMDYRLITTLFFLINGFVLLIAMWTSYNAHPKDPKTFHMILNEYEKARKNEVESLQKFEMAKKRLEQANDALNIIISNRQNGFNARQNEANEYIDICNNVVNYYRTKNLQCRLDKASPKCFEKEIEIRFPDSLKELLWDWDLKMVTSSHS